MQEGNIFPYDHDTLSIIKEMEEYLGLTNKDIDKINYTELIKYIDQITLILLYK
ncbi:MAG: hypothetical protein KIB53_14535 [Paraclostridium bifermentans]|uniref:hypothetical protein n=1 Tax=Clostridia TaxID=186801 RepID=UPI00241BEEA6|nr:MULTISPECIES: hypothetical protein [Clostridiaceae]MBS5955024.1 hypothetical protein [Paraclostridium bifermentans]CAI3245092.1 conserved hypothetical protein [Clostridium neonatale]CAI3630859.1 conserved hypothetical protein [Clostridium neonatale]